MNRLAQRRVTAILLLLAAVGGLLWFEHAVAPQIGRPAHLTGWSLLAVMLGLTLYNGRKQLPFLPAGGSSAWLQSHIYLGWFSAALFGAHLSWSWPAGRFNSLLALLFVLTVVSGALGLAWSRLVPRRLTARGGEVLFERIPVIRRELAAQAEAMALQSVSATRSTALADLHRAHLQDFLAGNRHFFLHLAGSTRPLRRLEGRLEDLQRFLNPDQQRALAELTRLVRQKDGLDFHYAQQLGLKLWLFTHIPLTYGLLTATAVHVVLVYGFAADVPLR